MDHNKRYGHCFILGNLFAWYKIKSKETFNIKTDSKLGALIRDERGDIRLLGSKFKTEFH